MKLRALVFLLLALAIAPVGAQAPAEPVERIRAAFLYRFAAYVEWPASAFPGPESPIVIGVVASDAVALELAKAIPGRKVGSRPLKVVRLGPAEQPGNCCHILYVGAESDRTEEILAAERARPVLTVTDVDSGHPKGSVINFVLADERLRFDISREAAERNGLQLRSQLLAVARQVSTP